MALMELEQDSRYIFPRVQLYKMRFENDPVTILLDISTYFYFRKVTSLIHGKLGSRVHLLETVQDIRPEVILLHRPPVVVDLVKNVHDPGADQDGRVIKVVHEAVKDGAEFTHLLRTIFLQCG